MVGVPGMSRAGNASGWQVLIMLNPNRVTVFYRLGVGKQNGDACDRLWGSELMPNTRQILVVDDDPELREALSEQLSLYELMTGRMIADNKTDICRNVREEELLPRPLLLVWVARHGFLNRNTWLRRLFGLREGETPETRPNAVQFPTTAQYSALLLRVDASSW
jgi:hypothetical protein